MDLLSYLDSAIQDWEGSILNFSLKEVTILETLTFIKKLGNTTAHGLDGLDALTIKTAMADLADPLTHIINVSLRTMTFANKWKLSKIIILLKSKE